CALSPARVRQYHTALCVPPDGAFGSDTRRAIHDFLVARRVISPTDRTDTITDRNKAFFDNAVGVVCSAAGFKNAYEVGRLGDPVNGSQAITSLQQDLGKLVTPAPEQTGKLDQPTRNAIAEVCPPTTS